MELVAGQPKALSACTKRIRSANDKFSTSFHDWITTVGGELRKAQELLSKDGSHDSQFGKWCTDEFGWTRQHAYHLLHAEESMRLLSTTVDGKALPTTERQCRELVCVPDDDLPKVWKQVVKFHDLLIAS